MTQRRIHSPEKGLPRVPEIQESDPDWRKRSACAGAANPLVFFPRNAHDVLEAQAFCRRCVVKADCLNYAKQFPETPGCGGVFGGVWFRSRSRQGRQEVVLA